MNNACINCLDYGRVLNMSGQSFTGYWICLGMQKCMYVCM